MTRVLKAFHSFTCTPTRSSTIEWAIPAFAFPTIAGTHLQTPEGWRAVFAWPISPHLADYWVIPPVMCTEKQRYTVSDHQQLNRENWHTNHNWPLSLIFIDTWLHRRHHLYNDIQKSQTRSHRGHKLGHIEVTSSLMSDTHRYLASLPSSPVHRHTEVTNWVTRGHKFTHVWYS